MAAQKSVTVAPAPRHQLHDLSSDDEVKQAVENTMYDDQDDVQAVMQPAMSRAASHFTSIHTPAVEKVAAMERMSGFFDSTGGEESNDDDHASPKSPSTPKDSARRSSPLGITLPDDLRVEKDARSRQTRGVLSSAFGPTRHHRSGSAGQEALKRFQRVLPSFSTSSNFFPSINTKYFNNITDSIPSISIGGHTKNSKSEAASDEQKRLQARATIPVDAVRESSDSSRLQPRRLSLRRTTSDESILYHSLSRQSSLGDDDRFHDVREMVNMRLVAFKDSLPDVPNFKMPSLARLQATAKRSQLSLNGIFSSESSVDVQSRDLLVDAPSKSKDKFDSMLQDLTGDVVILGGYRGSILRSAEPPHHQVWAPLKLGLGLRKVDLEVGLTDEDEETMRERIIPSGMLKQVGPIDVSQKLFRKLQSSRNAQAGRLRVWDFGYDWRLSPRRLSKHLQEFLATLPCNKAGIAPGSRGAIVIAHSLGGLITRHAVNQRPDLFSGVLFAGTPHQCMNILGPLRNGDAVLFNEKLLTARVNFSIRTSFALLPEDSFCFVDKNTGEDFPVDFLDPMSWVKYRLSPCIEPPLPPLNKNTNTSALTSLLPQSFLRPRSDSKGDKNKDAEPATAAPIVTGPTSPVAWSDALDDITEEAWLASVDDERRRSYLYLKRTLADIRLFREEMRHSSRHQDSNAYPPLSVLYGKAIPTVCAAGVNGREGIACADAYDDLIFRSGDGVTLAKEAMLPPGYSIVRGGRVSTERGHITMLGDMPALGKALSALLRGRRKGIGLGHGLRGSDSP